MICNSLREGQWTGYSEPESNYSVLISPSIEEIEKPVEGWEECPSIPGVAGLVERPSEIEVSYYNESNEDIEEKLEGFRARVLQHEIDHMHGLTLLHTLTTHWRVKMLPGVSNPEFEAVVEANRELTLSAAKTYLQEMDEDPDKLSYTPSERLRSAIMFSFQPKINQQMINAAIQALRSAVPAPAAPAKNS